MRQSKSKTTIILATLAVVLAAVVLAIILLPTGYLGAAYNKNGIIMINNGITSSSGFYWAALAQGDHTVNVNKTGYTSQEAIVNIGTAPTVSEARNFYLLSTQPDTICFDGLDNNGDGRVDENCPPFIRVVASWESSSPYTWSPLDSIDAYMNTIRDNAKSRDIQECGCYGNPPAACVSLCGGLVRKEIVVIADWDNSGEINPGTYAFYIGKGNVPPTITAAQFHQCDSAGNLEVRVYDNNGEVASAHYSCPDTLGSYNYWHAFNLVIGANGSRSFSSVGWVSSAPTTLPPAP